MRNKIIISAVAIFLFTGGAFFVWKERSLTTIQPQTNESKSELLASVNTWQTYKNKEYGFEIGYPADWETPKNFQKIGDVPTLLISPKSYFEGCCTGLKVEVREGNSEEFHKKMLLDYPKEDILSDNLINFNGNEGREIVFLTHYGDKNERVLAVPLNNRKRVLVLRWGEGDNLVDQIVATLKLLDQDQLMLQNWKKYSNKEYGFEFKYPKEWKVDEERSDKNQVVFDTGFPGSREAIYLKRIFKILLMMTG